jgi:DNA polymerase, archaea type
MESNSGKKKGTRKKSTKKGQKKGKTSKKIGQMSMNSFMKSPKVSKKTPNSEKNTMDAGKTKTESASISEKLKKNVEETTVNKPVEKKMAPEDLFKVIKPSKKQIKKKSKSKSTKTKKSQKGEKNDPKTSGADSKDIAQKDDFTPIPLQKKFFDESAPPKPIGDQRYSFDLPRNQRENQRSWHLRIVEQAGEFIQEMEQGLLLTVEYDGNTNKAYARFYDMSDNTIKFWMDTTNHRPYCYHKSSIESLQMNEELTEYPGFDGFEAAQKYDLLEDKLLDITRIYGKTPTDIGGTSGIRTILEGAWEARIRYHHNYIYDTNLTPGMYYQIKKGKIIPIKPNVDESIVQQLREKFKDAPMEIKEMAEVYHPVFSTLAPPLKRLAFDIEVEESVSGNLPNPMLAKERVISISFATTDDKKIVYCLDRDKYENGAYPKDFDSDTEVLFFKEEKRLLEESFRLIWEYPLILTFNGDNFDNTYLYHRARKLKIDPLINPISVERGGGMVAHKTDYKQSIHIDIFQFFANRSIKGYVFGNAYLRNSLEEVSNSLLGHGKIKHEGVLIGDMTLANLIHYNMEDSNLTLRLSTFKDELMMHLLIILMRITKLPLQDIFRLQISAWVRSLMYYEHRRKNYIIPRTLELEERGHFSKNKVERFQGALVIDPVPGIHFNVAVLDFSSLYPSIIKTKNLSYETVNCIHKECEDNFLPNINYSSCTKKTGIFAYVVGYLRDVRVKWFKSRSNDKSLSIEERQSAKVLQGALKVFINGSYGVFGSPVFPLYFLPVAEATTAIGRFSIQETIKKAQSMDVKVLYGDSDSVFLWKPTPEQVEELIAWSEKTLDLDLELEKTYQFLALSDRKKNYIGVRVGGTEVDLKGLLAKKHNTPGFIKEKFAEVQEILTKIVDMDTFDHNRNKIIRIIRQTVNLIGKLENKGGYSIEKYGITVNIRKKLDAYVKTVPQHIRAVKMLPESEQKKLKPGSYITFVKTRNTVGVKPLSQANITDLDYSKYKEMVQSTFEQVLDALSIDYNEIKGIKKLSSFFG